MGMPEMVGQVGNNIYGLWIFISIAAILALIFTMFNYYENMMIKQAFEDDAKRLEQNEEPENQELKIIHEKKC